MSVEVSLTRGWVGVRLRGGRGGGVTLDGVYYCYS